MKKVSLLCVSLVALVAIGISNAQSEMDFMLYATLNPAETQNDAIVMLDAELSEIGATFGGFEGITNVQSLDIASDGTAYVSVDVAEGVGGLVVIEGFASAEPMAVGMGTRMIGGQGQAGIVSPKGVEIIESLSVVLVANFGANNIKGFALDASGDVTPTLFINDLGGASGSVWDMLYVESTDTLYAAGTAGDVIAYDNFSQDMGAVASRVITPANADGEKISVNLHGLVYDEPSDSLIVTDVGAADNNKDGDIFVIPAISTANGNTAVSLHILGPASRLGNPVDAWWDGSGLYVAEKANRGVFYFADLLSLSGTRDQNPSIRLDAAAPESLAIYTPMN
jgi:hypothetical protein